jgi:hypothetical protein
MTLSPYRGAKGPLHLLIDSTGIRVEAEGAWPIAGKATPGSRSDPAHTRHGGPKRRVWRKITLVLMSRGWKSAPSGSPAATGVMHGCYHHLLSQIPRDQEIGRVTADGACDTRRCHNAIADRGAFGSSRRAEMPSRGSQPPQVPSRATRRCRRRNIWVGHSGGTGAATTAGPENDPLDRVPGDSGDWLHGVKPPGQRLMARDFDRQVVAVQRRIAVLNGYTAPGIPITKAAS